MTSGVELKLSFAAAYRVTKPSTVNTKRKSMADNQPEVEVTEEVEEIDVGDGADPTYQLDPGASYC